MVRPIFRAGPEPDREDEPGGYGAAVRRTQRGGASDAFIPFRDNIDRAARSHVTHIMQTGGSLRDADVTAAADEHGMVMLHSGMRHFLH